MKDLSWIEEAWLASREPDVKQPKKESDLLTSIEKYYEYQQNKRAYSKRQSGQQGSAPGSDI